MDTSQFKTVEECNTAITLRERRIHECVGWLYPSIMRSEIAEISARKLELRKDKHDHS